jgi:hypothetical protein
VLEHFRDGAPPENSGAAYLRNLLIEDAIYRSAETGPRITLAGATSAA